MYNCVYSPSISCRCLLSLFNLSNGIFFYFLFFFFWNKNSIRKHEYEFIITITIEFCESLQSKLSSSELLMLFQQTSNHSATGSAAFPYYLEKPSNVILRILKANISDELYKYVIKTIKHRCHDVHLGWRRQVKWKAMIRKWCNPYLTKTGKPGKYFFPR